MSLNAWLWESRSDVHWTDSRVSAERSAATLRLAAPHVVGLAAEPAYIFILILLLAQSEYSPEKYVVDMEYLSNPLTQASCFAVHKSYAGEEDMNATCIHPHKGRIWFVVCSASRLAPETGFDAPRCVRAIRQYREPKQPHGKRAGARSERRTYFTPPSVYGATTSITMVYVVQEHACNTSWWFVAVPQRRGEILFSDLLLVHVLTALSDDTLSYSKRQMWARQYAVSTMHISTRFLAQMNVSILASRSHSLQYPCSGVPRQDVGAGHGPSI
ncbi:hypothetical protein BV25DRAFT_1252607 [Artomyces pyxidatus]|uniref:Uncharacterized protein n=1 Tax=Artomyces pyxidatus TaxID=48021 RepID=A0ACB8TEK6_9AGAM|nr:hypothetical protein BV25DRAFT_1252607 [Artomyces pyxidatus]